MLKRLKELLFQNRSTKQTITKNLFWLSFGQVASRLIRGIIIIYAARIMGANEYGLFSYLLSLAGLFTIFADIGINQTITREIAQKPAEAEKYFSTSFFIKTILFLLTTTLIIFAGPYFSKIEGVAALIHFVAIIVIFDGIREFSMSLFRAREKMELEAVVTLATNLSITLLGFGALYFSTTSELMTLSYSIATGIGALISIIILKSDFKKILVHFNKNLIKPILSMSWPVALTGIIGAFMLNTDTIMLGWWRTAEEIGLYSSGQRIIQMLYTFPAILASAIFPTLSRLIGQKNHEKITQLMELSLTASFLIAFPMAIGGIILGSPIIKFIYGNEYLPGTSSFQVLATTMIIIFPSTLIGNAILAFNKQKSAIIYMSVAAFGNMFFNAILIPRYGIVGSSIATLISQAISNVIAWMVIKKVNDFKIFIHIKKIIFSSIIMGTFSYFLNILGINVLLNIAISSFIYFLMLFILKEKLLEETKSLIKMIKISPL